MKKALFVTGGWEGHQPRETSQFFAELLQGRGFKVEQRDSLDVFTDVATLKSFDLIIPNWTMGGALTQDQLSGLIAAVEEHGAGLGGWHGGMGDAFRGSLGYEFMIGGHFVAHPDNDTDYTVHIVKKSDPIMQGISDFKIHSEQYYMLMDPYNDVLATTTFVTKSKPWLNGTVMPAVWKRQWGAGRVFYSSLGHNMDVFQIPEAKEIQLRGLEWACR